MTQTSREIRAEQEAFHFEMLRQQAEYQGWRTPEPYDWNVLPPERLEKAQERFTRRLAERQQARALAGESPIKSVRSAARAEARVSRLREEGLT